MEVSVIIPAKNEEGNIERIAKSMPNLNFPVEIIFVEGHSNDATLKRIQEVCQGGISGMAYKYIIQSGKGKGNAVREAVDIALGKFVIILDADLTVCPSVISDFYIAIQRSETDLIIGNRFFFPMEQGAMGCFNKIGNHFFSYLLTKITGQKINDSLCGVKAFTLENWRKIQRFREDKNFQDPFGDFDLILGASYFNMRINDIPVHYKARKYGKSNISVFRDGLKLMAMVLAFQSMKE